MVMMVMVDNDQNIVVTSNKEMRYSVSGESKYKNRKVNDHP